MIPAHPLHALYAAETGRAVEPGPLTCWFCGHSCADGVDVAEAIRSTFSDMARARAGGDGPVCASCAHYLGFKILRDGGKRGMGLYTKTVIVAAGEHPRWSEWDREQMADDCLLWSEHGTPEPTYLTVNYSKQKHVLPWAKLTPAGSRWLWISTDVGYVRLAGGWPAHLWCVAWLWSRGYPKTLLSSGALAAHHLAKSDDPATDLAAARALGALSGSLTDILSYLVTETNRDRIRDTLAGRVAPILGRDVTSPAARRPARSDPQRCGEPDAQEPLSEAVVADAGGAGQALRHDERKRTPLEQLTLL